MRDFLKKNLTQKFAEKSNFMHSINLSHESNSIMHLLKHAKAKMNLLLLFVDS